MHKQDERRVKCPACQGVGFVRANRVGDPFFTCSNCGPWNGRGPKFRQWCDDLPDMAPAVEVEDNPPSAAEVEMAQRMGDADRQTDAFNEPADWLEEWGNA